MRTLLIEGDKTFKIEIPDDAKVTYGPWAPPKNRQNGQDWNNTEANKRGTLRIYAGTGVKENSILACFAGVTSFRDVSSIRYSELIAKQEVASVWKDDEKGYVNEQNQSIRREWVDEPKLIAAPKSKQPTKRRK